MKRTPCDPTSRRTPRAVPQERVGVAGPCRFAAIFPGFAVVFGVFAVTAGGCAPATDSSPPRGTGGAGSGGAPGTGGGDARTGGAPGSGGAGLVGVATGGVGTGGSGGGGVVVGTGGAGTGGRGDGGRVGTTGGAGPAGGTTGSAGTGGPAAGGTNGGAGAGGDSQCASGRYAICEGFEGTAVGNNVVPAGWSRSGSIDIVSEPANVYRGTRAMRANAAVNGARWITKSGADLAKLGTGHWGRVFYKVQTPAPVSCDSCCGGVLHATFVELQGVGPMRGAGQYRVVDTVENQAGMHQFIYNIQSAGSEVGRGSAYNYKYDGKWHCAEWHIDNPTSTFQFFIDGSPVSLSGNAGDFPPSFSQLRVGINNYQMACSPYLVTWIDELALDPVRIGCGN